jgi:hypothetical protein
MVAFVRVQPAQVAELERYENTVLGLLPDHGGLVERRLRSADGRIEAHLLDFPSREAIDAYDDDPRRAAARDGIDGSGVEGLRYLLEAADGPEGIVLWRFVADELLSILLEPEQTLADVDLLLVADILFDVDRYVAAGHAFARAGLGADVPFDAPELTFYPGDEWVLRLADSGENSDGIIVVFEGHEPARLEDLGAGEILE